jgi:CheY-like chemotaxis protein
MTTWDDQIQEVRKQMADLQAAQQQNEQVVASHTKSVEQARTQLQKILQMQASAGDLIGDFISMMRSTNPDSPLGWLLLDSDGIVVVQNPAAQRLLLDSTNGQLSAENICDGRTGFPMAESELPWQQCIKGGTAPSVTRMIVRRPDIAGEVYLETTTLPLQKGKETIGAWVLFVDATEAVKAHEFIHNLYLRFEQYLSSVEGGHRDLQSLTEKLGMHASSVTAEAVTAEPSERSTTSVLIVDDIPVNQKLLAMQMKNSEVDIEFAMDGNEAVQLMQKKKYALVFMDCDMPVLDGLQATKEIRRFEDTIGTHTPIVAMTSYDREGDRERCLAHGMDDYLVKGAGKARVREIVDQYVFGRAPSPTISGQMETFRSSSSEDELDMEWLTENFGDETQGIILLFLGTASALLNCMEFAFETKDAQAIRHFAYSLKGLFANFKLTLVARLAGQMSEDTTNGLWPEAYDIHQRLRRFLGTLKQQVDAPQA